MARILLVEDDPDNLNLLTRLLQHNGHEIYSAINAADAVSQALEHVPELILMDLQLPPDDNSPPDPNAGLVATKKIKAEETTNHIPIIALTAHTMPQHRERISEAGCDDFQEKPIYPFDNLLEKIGKFCS
ncbi:MAG: response regulator [Verrucomicrobiales bacterium]|nr:response regulator [Verrucomicrobiales bacterium]